MTVADRRPWSYGVAKRCLANKRRGDDRRLRLVGRVQTDSLTYLGHGQHSSTNETSDDLTKALSQLDTSERELVRLWAWEQLEPREIAIVLDTTANVVSLRLARVKKKMALSIRQSGISAGHEVIGNIKETRS